MKVVILIAVLLGIALCMAVSVWLTTGGHLRWRAARGKPAPRQSPQTTAVTVAAAVVLIAVGLYVQSQH